MAYRLYLFYHVSEHVTLELNRVVYVAKWAT